MAKCYKIYRTIKRVCIGSLNKKIIINTRSIANKQGQYIDFTEKFGDPITVSAMIETVSGITVFDEVNQEHTVSHIFYIRHIENFTSEKWIEYDGRYFNILNVDRLNEENRFLKLMCEERGAKTIAANML